MLLGQIGHLLQKASSPRSGNVINYLIHKNKNSNLGKKYRERKVIVGEVISKIE